MATQIRRSIIEQSMRAHVGHIGSALSIADILAALFGEVLHVLDCDDPDRDRLVLSKGHAALALYAALHAAGRMSRAELDSYCQDGSLLGGHPEQAVPGIDFCTGSLGHGLSIAAGAALAGRLKGSARRSFAVLSDAECNEGSVWEAAMFASHQKLANLIAIIDANGQQALGHTRDVLDLEPMPDRWAAFGWDVHEADGHDPTGLARLIAGMDDREGPPHVIVARTTFGKGVSFMEGQLAWHYWPMNQDQFAQAIQEIVGTGAGG
jgi:transketolase